MKHAYLILAHDNLYILERLIVLLDDVRNDIYIHLDAKLRGAEEWIDTVCTQHSNLVFIKRRNVYWGGYSLVDATLDLLKESMEREEYSWFHLIGGTSLPLKTQEEIHAFFDSDDRCQLYFHINDGASKTIQNRAKAYYPFIETKTFRKNKILKGLSLIIGEMQIIFGIDRLHNNELSPLYNGWGWFSIPHDFAKYLYSKKELIEKTFKYTLASDEVWLHSVAAHSEVFSRRLHGYNVKCDPMKASKLFQDWNRGRPYVFTKEDYNLLMEGNECFWARKFDVKVDKDIVDMIFETIKRKQENAQ